MSKLITSLFTAMMLVSTSACAKTIHASKNIVTKTVTVKGFNSITTMSSVDVEYTPSTTQNIVISAPDNLMEYIEVKVSNKNLEVGYKENLQLNILNSGKVVVKVSAPDVTSFTTMSSGDIDIKSNLVTTDNISLTTYSSGDIETKAIKCNSLKATTNSSGDIKVENVDAVSVNADTRSSGDIKLAGKCTNASFSTNSSGDIKAKSLTATNVNAATFSSGDIYCTGKNVNTRESSSGDIHVNRL